MPMLINNPGREDALIAQRREGGIDGHDEVWDGVYVMAPIANNEHQDISTSLTVILGLLIMFPRLGRVHGGANVSDQLDDWTQNYRVPDVLVFLNGNPAQDRGSHWLGGPDFAIEIASPGDRSREKIDFYSRVGVRELLIIDRDPWQLELFRPVGGRLQSAVVATPADAVSIQSEIVGITLGFVPGEKRPGIAVASRDGQSWTI